MLAFSSILLVILGVISTVLIYYIARKFAGDEAALLSALIFAKIAYERLQKSRVR
jgi:asparagine N-glycosylation enzyme membrane subunit Stt3